MKLLFIYNAKSGKRNTLLDACHKLFSPNTYKCSLCALTHNTFDENKRWKNFRSNTNIEMLFFHNDEFEKQFPKANYNYPIILSEKDEILKVFITPEDLNMTLKLDDLIKTILAKTCL